MATILSAQTTDVRVNEVTPKLFARYRTAADYASADRAELEELIHSTGFYRNKATSLIGLGAAVVEKHDGVLPHTLDELVALPGIGRKTANVILGNAFDIPGITVDTHFGRLVRRWGWTAEDDPVKVEHAVGALVPKRDWTIVSHEVIFHGRRVCHARKPACGACTLAADCPSYGTGPTDPAQAAALVKGPSRERLLRLAGRPGRRPAVRRAGSTTPGRSTPGPTRSRPPRTSPDMRARSGATRAEVLSTAVVVALVVLGIVALWPRSAEPSAPAPPHGRTGGDGRRPRPAARRRGPRPLPGAERSRGGGAAGRRHRALPRRARHRRPRGRPRRPARAAQRVGVVVRPVPRGAARAGRVRPAPGRGPGRRDRRPGRPPVRARPAARAGGDPAVRHRPGRRRCASALAVPPALPVSYVVRADGSVTRVDPPTPFTSADDGGRGRRAAAMNRAPDRPDRTRRP